MNCKNCGNPLTVEDKFCKKCGTAVMQVANEVSNTVAEVAKPEPTPFTLPSVEPVKTENPIVNEPAPVTPSPMPATSTPTVAPQPMPAPATPVAPTPMAGPIPVQPVNQVNPAPMAPPKAKTNPILLIIIALLAAAAGYFGYKALFANDGNGGIIASATNKINYNGYTFEVPKEYSTKITTDGLEMESNLSYFSLEIETGIYSTFNFKALNGTHEGYTFVDKGDKTYGSTKYHLYEVSLDKVKFYFVIFDLGGTRIGEGMVGSNADPYSIPSQSALNDFMKIATTGKYTGSNSIESKTFSIKEVIEAIGTSEEPNTGDYIGEYTDTYVNIMVDEINE